MCRLSQKNPRKIWDSAGHLQGSKGLSLGNSEKSLQRRFQGLSAPGSKRARQRVENGNFSSIFRVFDSFSTFFGPFLTPGPRGLGNPFSDFFWSFPRRGLFDPCRWPTISQRKRKKKAKFVGKALRAVL